MIAVLKHELKNYFRSLTAYIFGAFLLVFVGIGAMMYNLNSAVSNFEYVLSFSSIVFVIIVPILTMSVIAEERKQKTDQLLYSLPISTSDIILGKYLALLIVYLLPLCIISFYPLIFSQYGDVYLLTSYGSLAAFFLMGATLIALGIFISSLTDNQGFAAGIGIAVILLNYFSVSLAEYVSSTANGSALTLFVLADYNIEVTEGIVIEGDRTHYASRAPYALIPDMESSDMTDPLIEAGYYPTIALSQGLQTGYTSNGTVTELLTTSEDAFSKISGYALSTYEKEEGDVDGPFALAVSIETDGSGQIIWFATSALLDDMYNAYSSGANVDLAMNALSSLIGEREALAIRSKSLN